MTLPSTQTLDLIRDHAASEPYEAVGVIHPDGTITPLLNQARSASRFMVNPTQLKERLLDRMERGLNADIWGIYHSHILPNSTTTPSVYDLDFMATVEPSLPGIRHVIVTDSAMSVWRMKHGQPQSIAEQEFAHA